MSNNSVYNLLMVFERTTGWNFSEITITPRMIQILAMMDGCRNAAQIGMALGLIQSALFTDIQKLHDLRLIKIKISSITPPEPQKNIKVKKAYYRGAAFEVIVDEHNQIIPKTAIIK